jgi:hypothetical protein
MVIVPLDAGAAQWCLSIKTIAEQQKLTQRRKESPADFMATDETQRGEAATAYAPPIS